MAEGWIRGKVAVVTGASRGIGRATAQQLAGAGAHCVLAARSQGALEEAAAAIRAQGGQALAVPCDVSEPAQVEALFEAASNLGPVGALVCAAGLLRKAPFPDLSQEQWHEVLGVNLFGTFICCQRAFASMRRSGGGRIVTLGSLSGVYATEKFPGLLAYNVSKYGVVGLTEGLAVEGRPYGISAICVSPGAVDTEMLRQANPELRPGLTPDEVGRLILALLDDAVVAASGANIPLFSNR